MLTINNDDTITLKTDDYEIAFHKSELGKRVSYNHETGQLILTDLPDGLIEQIEQALQERDVT